MGAPLVGGARGSKLRTQKGKSLTELLYPFETVTLRMYLQQCTLNVRFDCIVFQFLPM